MGWIKFNDWKSAQIKSYDVRKYVAPTGRLSLSLSGYSMQADYKKYNFQPHFFRKARDSKARSNFRESSSIEDAAQFSATENVSFLRRMIGGPHSSGEELWDAEAGADGLRDAEDTDVSRNSYWIDYTLRVLPAKAHSGSRAPEVPAARGGRIRNGMYDVWWGGGRGGWMI